MDYYIFCDESCHTLGNNESIMGFGAIRLPKDKLELYKAEINAIKRKYNANGELKFTKINQSKFEFYKAIIDWFISKDDLLIRTLIVENADRLNHNLYNQNNPDIFYYKMYYLTLTHFLEVKVVGMELKYSILLDYKDSLGGKHVSELRKILEVAFNPVINGPYLINSRDSVFIQLVDFIIGLVTYRARGLEGNRIKIALIEKLEERFGSLKKKSLKSEMKFNRFIFTPR